MALRFKSFCEDSCQNPDTSPVTAEPVSASMGGRFPLTEDVTDATFRQVWGNYCDDESSESGTDCKNTKYEAERGDLDGHDSDATRLVMLRACALVVKLKFS
ncbi:uncharacterized protein L201_007828 [Kwoniella dendrophila CBS 6074]|uniref:Uncharacterized protein n=1 Tax=Kwoniella dendrophila CBS 6074 TaxID=1295534 RepID=A0AAX4K5E4_9TREE